MMSDSSHARDPQFLAEQLRTVSRINNHVIHGVSVGAIFILVLLNRANDWNMVTALWITGVVIAVGGHILWGYRLRIATPSPAMSHLWLQRWTVLRACTGIVWGLTGAFIFPEMHDGRWPIFMMLLTGMVAATMMSISYRPANYAFIIPAIVPMIIRVAFNGTIEGGIAAAMFTIFLFGVLQGTDNSASLILTSFRLRFENVELIEALRLEKSASEQARHEAESANRAKSRFLAAASHDLRQPMYALNIYLGILTHSKLPEAARAVVEKTKQCTHSMNKLFEALLEISRFDASTVAADMQTFPIAPLLERMRVQFEPAATAKGVDLRVLPCTAFIYSDPALVERILSNFVSNAVRYTQQGKILVGCRRSSNQLRVTVYDTGPGIPKDKLQAVFEEFYQIGNEQHTRDKGLGLGLAIVKRLAHLVSAPVTLVSESGRGSAFGISLPIAHNAPATISQPPASSELDPDTLLAEKLIVLVDDDSAVLDASRSLLQKWGCEVIAAASGNEVLRKLTEDRRVPDLLICDYRLYGEESGIDVIAALRCKFDSDIPALLVTGDSGPERSGELRASGLPVLYKPINNEDFYAAVLELLSEQTISVEDA